MAPIFKNGPYSNGNISPTRLTVSARGSLRIDVCVRVHSCSPPFLVGRSHAAALLALSAFPGSTYPSLEVLQDFDYLVGLVVTPRTAGGCVRPGLKRPEAISNKAVHCWPCGASLLLKRGHRGGTRLAFVA